MSTPLQNIRVLALDVDGVLTDGSITHDPVTKKEIKTFHVHDGLGISLWQKLGLDIILLSGRNAECVTQRAEELGISHVLQGSKDKVSDIRSTLDTLGVSFHEVAYVGDDLIDIAIMVEAGYAIAVQNAAPEVKEVANWTTPRSGGNGAVRDAIEHILRATDKWEAAVESLGSGAAVQ